MKILIIGMSVRAMAESAVHSGYTVEGLDAFGDLDLQDLIKCYSLKRDFNIGFSATALFDASHGLSFDDVAYTSNLENHPEVVRRFARHHRVLGNSANVLVRVRHWPTLSRMITQAGFQIPETIYDGDNWQPNPARIWLRKPILSGGGHDITFCHDKASPGRGFMFQEYMPGLGCSASFFANGRECVVVGLTEQLLGRPEFGSYGFHYCGNLLPLDAARDLSTGLAILDQVQEIAMLVTREFGLVGVNGMDWVLNNDQVFLTEINPRYAASMELIEQAYGLPMFDLHVRAVLRGELPEFDLATRLADRPFYGKAILYAEKDAVAVDTYGWLERGIRDVPVSGESLTQGRPICTVLACEPTHDQCMASLVSQAQAIKGEIYA
jgi:predicted ATP-grasp superfamily ATP-dependent carboligase